MNETIICLLWAGSLTAILLIIFYKFFKFYDMESKKQSANNQTVSDLRAGQVRVFDYVQLIFDGTRVLAMVVDVNDNNEKLLTILSGTGKGQKRWVASTKAMEVIPTGAAISELSRLKKEWKEEKREEAIAKRHEEFRNRYGNILPGSYLKTGGALYLVESVDVDAAKATAVRLLCLGPNFPAGEKCVLYLVNNFTLVTAEEAAEILLK